MRWFAAVLACALCLAPARGLAADPPAPPPPMPQAQAVDLVLAAHAAKDEARIAELAAKDLPDPWLVADELFQRGNLEAALAFARAKPRPDITRLAEFLTARKPQPGDAAVRDAFVAWNAAMRAKDVAKALAVLDGVTPPEDALLASRLAYARGLSLRAVPKHAESSLAFEASAKAAERVGWLARTAMALHEAGFSAYSHPDLPRTLALWERVVAVQKERALELLVADAVSNVAIALGRLRRNDGAIAASVEALAVYERLGLEAKAGLTLGNLGVLYIQQGDTTRALDAYERSLALAERSGDKAGVAYQLLNIAIVRSGRGDDRAAVPALERALMLGRETGSKDVEISALNSLANAQRHLGDLLAARTRYEESMRAAEAAGRRDLAATALGNLGHVHATLGDYDQALAAHRKALEVAESLGLAREASLHVSNLADVHFRMGQLEEAATLNARALRMAEAAGDVDGVLRITTNLGLVHLKRSEYDQALEVTERALKRIEERGDPRGAAVCRLAIGRVWAGRGDFAKAVATVERALEDIEKSADLRHRQAAWGDIAAYRLAAGDDAGAVVAAKTALEAAQRLLRGQAEEQQATGRLETTAADPAGALAAAHLGDAATVAFFLESGRGGALLESLGGRSAVRAVTIPETLQKAEVEANAAERLASRRLREATAAGKGADLSALAAEQERARAALKDVFERIQREAKAAAHVSQPVPDDLATIRSRLRADEALVLYLTGVNGLFNPEALALVVTKAEARVVRLGAPQEIDQAAALAVVTGPGHDLAGPAATLRSRLVAPLALGPETKRLIVSPSGALAYVPFAVLTDLPVCYVPSGSVLGALQADGALKGSGVLALGDPQYAASKKSGARGLDLAALPATREEARAIGDVVLLGADATPAKFAAALAKRPRWRAVHLACHGLVDPDRPMLSRLALTPDGDSDGFLTALEVLRLRIPADLTVLSACETGKGKIVRGEGVLGLTRAFMYAGAPRVLVSLWKVDDAATRLLMEKFHAGWKDGKLGAAAALRAAQNAVRDHEVETVDKDASRAAGRDVVTKRKPYADPFFWAGWALWGLPE